MDKEIKAMGDIIAAFDGLDEEAIARVLRWALQRYKIGKGPIPTIQLAEGASPNEIASKFSSFHELFDAANPASAADKALVAGYWFQVLRQQDDLDSQQLNTELKNLGHPSTNITRDLDALIGRTPRHVIQVRKEGKTKQARKRYKLTREGIKAVERLLQQESAPEGDEANA